MSVKRSGHYKGYFVTAYPYQLKTGGWRADIDVSDHRGGDVVITGFYGTATFLSEDAAIQAGLRSACDRIEVGFTPEFSNEIPTLAIPVTSECLHRLADTTARVSEET